MLLLLLIIEMIIWSQLNISDLTNWQLHAKHDEVAVGKSLNKLVCNLPINAKKEKEEKEREEDKK